MFQVFVSIFCNYGQDCCGAFDSKLFFGFVELTTRTSCVLRQLQECRRVMAVHRT